MRHIAALVATLLLFAGPAYAKSVHSTAKHVHHKTVKTIKRPSSVKKAAAARERTELLLPRITVSAEGELLPDLRAAEAIVYDPLTDTVIYQSNASLVRPIASITKIMTAEVFLETNPDLSQVVLVGAADTKQASHTYLRAGDRVTADDLMHLLLIASDNAAARVLARISPWGSAGFVNHMNDKAASLGLTNTTYADPSGLLKANMSTALDMARLIIMVSNNDYIAHVMQTAQYAFRTVAHRQVAFHTTDHLLMHKVPVMAAKTGFTNPAGFCLASLLQLPTQQTVAIVVLGARSNAERFIEVENLYQWVLLHAKAIALKMQDAIPADHLSERGMEFIKQVEGFHATPYYDSHGYAVGYGFHRWNGRPVTKHYPKSVTVEEADDQFVSRAPLFQGVLMNNIAVPLSQPAFDSLTSLVYNLGRVNDHIIEKLSVGRAVTLSDFLVTATVKHRPNAGLMQRRLREFVLFAGDYEGELLR